MTEKNAVARILLMSKKMYYMIKDGQDIGNAVSLLDEMSVALSPEIKPSKRLRRLKASIKAKNKPFYQYVKKIFSHGYVTPDYDEELAKKHIQAIIYANDHICAKLVSNQAEKAKSMCGAMASYPGFIFGEYNALSSKQFYDMAFGYYKKFYEDEFMEKMEYLFK